MVRTTAKTPALVAVMNNRHDWDIVQTDRWYRIPVKSAPRGLRRMRHVAFYQTKVFGAERWAVNYSAPILGSEVVRRRELLPEQGHHERADELYYRLRLGELTPLARPIVSRRLRRIAFIPTTWRKLQSAEEINDLWDESPLEDTVWEAFKREGIEAERQLYVVGGRISYCLDFAIACQMGQVDVECDGDTWHAQKDAIPQDNARNNFLTSRGWSVLRFSSREINEELTRCLSTVKDTANTLGGLRTLEGAPRLFRGSEQARQLSLW